MIKSLIRELARIDAFPADGCNLSHFAFAPACGELGGGGIHEAAFEEGLGHRLQRHVHPPVQLDLVVQGAEDAGNGVLFGDGGERERRVS